jgi:glycosyltransferase involved in cell wall biosynthesis
MTADVSTEFDNKKVCVLIPTYNNGQTLSHVIESVLRFTNNVIVVNDGSTDATEQILQRFPSVAKVSYVKNQGKGYALRQGFSKAIELGFDYAISIDSDGQHYADDLPSFIDALRDHPGAIIIGARNMEQSSVPGKSSFGNKFSNFWFRVETGLKMPDTQSGYRLYPVRLLQDISFVTRKYEFEIEVLVRAAWRGIDIKQIPVRVFYPEKDKRVTHFRPFKDFSRISVLNTVLVTIAFLYIKPRDLFRSIKKKISDRSYASICSTRRNLILSRQHP